MTNRCLNIDIMAKCNTCSLTSFKTLKEKKNRKFCHFTTSGLHGLHGVTWLKLQHLLPSRVQALKFYHQQCFPFPSLRSNHCILHTNISYKGNILSLKQERENEFIIYHSFLMMKIKH